ncbi:MAG: leucine-rich repeat domain-containing protein [Lachnospiraceae bacterium]|nr:leucine-rich repeat domain-containing protein [Lachnospiraceae bacterium]
MKKRTRKLLGVILIVSALLVMQLPPSGVDAASIPEFSVTGSGTLISYNGTKADVVIPSSVIEIATDAFRDNDNIRSVTIPNSVRKINEYAFWDCDNLQTVTIGSGLTKIDDFVFANCMGLVSVNLPANIRSVGIYAFEDDVNLEAVTFTQYTHDIHPSAFDGCYKLVIFAPEGSYAWDYAQEFYVRQKQFPVYEDLGYIDEDTVTVPDEPGDTVVIDETDGRDEPGAYTTEFEITQRPDGTYTAVAVGVNTDIYGESHVVGNTAVVFMDNSSLNVYDGRSSSENSSEEGITGNISSDSVRYSSTIPKYTIVDDLIVADKAYYMSSSLENMSLPDGIREIGQFAFSRTDVVSVTLPDSVEKIDYGAFYHCERLSDVRLPQTVIKIEPYAFSETAWVQDFLSNPGGINNNLDDRLNAHAGDFLVSGGALIAYRGTGSNVTVPAGVRIIAAGCFKDNKNIKAVALPSTLISIGEEAFYGCSSLNEVSFGGNEKEILDRAFAGTGISVADKPDRILNVGIGAFDDLDTSHDELNITYEETTQRLSNASLRPSVTDKDNAGVNVAGLSGAQAYLDGADRPYTLAISIIPVPGPMHDAMDRASGFLEDYAIGEMVCYNLTLTDSSGIPIAKLGNQGLEVALPLPDKLTDSNLTVLTCDRNGQLEDIPVDIVESPSGKYARFVTYHLSPFILCETGGDPEDQITYSDVVLRASSGGHRSGSDQGNAVKNWFVSRGTVRLIIAGLLVFTGVFLLAVRKRKA